MEKIFVVEAEYTFCARFCVKAEDKEQVKSIVKDTCDLKTDGIYVYSSLSDYNNISKNFVSIINIAEQGKIL